MWYTQGPNADRSLEKLGESDKGVVLFRKLLKEEMEKVQHGEEPMNVFRDPAKNNCIELPHEEKSRRGGYQRIQKGPRRRGNVGKYSQLREQVDALFAQAEQDEDEKGSTRGSTS